MCDKFIYDTFRIVYLSMMLDHAPVSPGRKRSPEKHAAILTAAADLVGEMGYERVSMEGIAARAGVGKMTVYRRWPGKAALYVDVYAHLVPPDALAGETDSLADDLKHLLTALFDLYRRTPAAAVLAGVIAAAQNDKAAKEALDSGLVSGRRGLLTGIFRRAVEAGELPTDFDGERAGDLFVALVWHRLLTDPGRLDDAYIDTIIDTVLMLGARP